MNPFLEFIIVMLCSVGAFVLMQVWVNFALKSYVNRCKLEYKNKKEQE